MHGLKIRLTQLLDENLAMSDLRKTVSLFSNIGVGEAYLPRSGYAVQVASELEAERCEVYRRINPDCLVLEGDIRETKNKFLRNAKDAFLLVATPPCQDYSSLNRRGTAPNNQLIFTTFEVINEIRPPYALLENVPQVVTAFKDQAVVDAVEYYLPDYEFNFKVVNAADFGTAQHRKRFILLLSRKGEPK
jgi:DNA (cytosine-5)-methyltransferase 1